MHLLKAKKGFRKEFRKQLRYAIAAACGFLIVFAWRDAIISTTKYIVEKIVKSTEIATTNVGTAIVITLLAVGLIILSSKLLKD